jgi:signal transduction histidine kinase
MQSMKTKKITTIKIMPLTAILCITYLCLLVVIDYYLLKNPIFRLSFYIICISVATGVLFISFYIEKKEKMGILIFILCSLVLSVLPLVLSHFFSFSHREYGDIGSTEYIILRNLPFLLMGLILVVTKFGFRSVYIYSTLVIVLLILLNPNRTIFGTKGLRPFGFLLFIYLCTFLIIGYFLNVLVQRLKKQNEKLALYATTLEELAISRERNRMARELHDTLAHTLSALSVQLETAKAYQQIDPKTVATIIDNSLKVTRSGMKETRQALKALRASPLEDLGLIKALYQLFKEAAVQGNLQLTINFADKMPTLSNSIEQCVYRISQEAVSNVVQYANAKHLAVKLEVTKDILLKISDDGIGFSVLEEQVDGHYGIQGMRERANMIGGTLTILSKLNKGTQVIFKIEDWK